MFFINVPLAAVALVVTVRHVPDSRDTTATGRLNIAGAGSVSVGLGGILYELIEAPVRGWTPLSVTAALVGALALAAFPLLLFRSAQFTGANLMTLAVYTALGGALFLLALQPQQSLSRIASLLAVAILPLAVGLDHSGTGPLGAGFAHAMLISAALCGLGGITALFTIKRQTPVQLHTLPGLTQPCQRGPLSNFRSVGRWPRLGRYHGRLLATPDRKHGAVALLDRGTTQAGHRRWTIGGVRHVHLITARSPQPGRGDGRNSAGSAVLVAGADSTGPTWIRSRAAPC